MHKFLKRGFILLLLALAGWITYRWYTSQKQEISPESFNLIPPGAIYCLATNEPITNWKEITKSPTWRHLQKNFYFAELTASANALDSLIRDNEILFDLLANRPVLVSTHMTSLKSYDFLFLANLEGTSGITLLKNYLSSFSLIGYNISQEKYRNQDLFILTNLREQTKLYVGMPKGYLSLSYTKTLVTQSIDAYLNERFETMKNFIKSEDDLDNSGLFQIYLDYSMLPAIVSCYTNSPNEYVSNLSKALLTTTLSTHVDDHFISARGNTYVNDSIESILKTLLISGKSESEIFEIAPTRTAFLIRLGFSSASDFFENFEGNLKGNVKEYEEYKRNLNQMENFLKIDLKKNFISWIGQEIGMLELQSSGTGQDSEVALAIKASNIEKARNELAYIQKMVKRRTPIKFKTVEHRGYEINYLSIKGLFKLLLGKFFARYDKPYYTLVDNFVVFSNHPQTLKSIIDDYLNKNNLSQSEKFQSFYTQFEKESSAFIYINTPVFFNSIKSLVDPSTQSSMEKNKAFIICFQQLGFQLTPERNRFKTLYYQYFTEPNIPFEAAPKLGSNSKQTPLSPTQEKRISDKVISQHEGDPMELPYIYAQDVNASSFMAYYPDSTIHFIVDLKNGFKDGDYTEYYPNGEVKLTGRFKLDKREGTWRRYDERGKVFLKRIYKDGEIAKEKDK